MPTKRLGLVSAKRCIFAPTGEYRPFTFPMYVPASLAPNPPTMGKVMEKLVVDQLNLLTQGAYLTSTTGRLDCDAVILGGIDKIEATVEIKTRSLTNSPTAIEFDPQRFRFLILVLLMFPTPRVFIFTRSDLLKILDENPPPFTTISRQVKKYPCRLPVTKDVSKGSLCTIPEYLLAYEKNWAPIEHFGKYGE